MITLTVNDGQYPAIDPDTPLLWALRDTLGLKGTKYGCGVGVCGSCTVLVDGEPLHACMTPVSSVVGRKIVTIEGLARNPAQPVLQAWIAEQVPQCGYCQPGQIAAATALLARNPSPSDAEIDEAMSAVLCRCGTYVRIRRAIHRAAAFMRDPLPPPPRPAAAEPDLPPAGPPLAPNAWVRIHRDGTVTVLIDRSEMGQGVVGTLSALVAEELEADPERIRTEFAPADPAYANRVFGRQLTGGSTSLRAALEPLRLAGAQAREMLIQAAALTLGVNRSECSAEHGTVVHRPTGRRLPYGDLVDKAATLPVPGHPPLKSAKDFRLIGKPFPRIDIPDLVSGRATFGIDVAVPGMLVATVARPPTIGGRVAHFDPSRTRQVEGVRHVIEIDSGIAVVADSTWAALAGRNALEVAWDEGPNTGLSSALIRECFERAAQRRGRAEQEKGNAEKVLHRAEGVVEATYTAPYLAHGTLEPMNCTAHVQQDRCDIWVPTQNQEGVRETAARLTGLPPAAVAVHTTFLGGGFGRRLKQDFVAEAVQVSKAVGAPVQVLWTREDDTRHDFFRPANYALFRAALDKKDEPVAWFQRVVGPELALDGVDIPYSIPNLRVEFVTEDPGVPTGAWRSVGASQNAFMVESFIDELAHAAGRDPLAFRRDLLAHAPRHRRVLELAAEKAGWGKPLPQGWGRGIAVYHSFGSWVAQVAEVSITGGTIRVHRVVCAVDCGMVVNPDTVAAQMEGAVAFGLSAAIHGQITIANGKVQQKNFEDYPLLVLREMPDVEVHILPSHEPPGGVGEPGVPPIAPAVANALFAATGERIRALPLRKLKS